VRALVFASRDVEAEFAEATRLVRTLNAGGIAAELVDKRSAKQADLLRVAAYGAVEPTLFVLCDASGLRVRRTTIPSAAEVRAMIAIL
jgi:hypothetical protein